MRELNKVSITPKTPTTTNINSTIVGPSKGHATGTTTRSDHINRPNTN
jgi:hypothetical protein